MSYIMHATVDIYSKKLFHLYDLFLLMLARYNNL